MDTLAPVDWVINYGNPRKGRAPLVIRVTARTAGEAKERAKEIARAAGYTGRMGLIRMVKPEAA